MGEGIGWGCFMGFIHSFKGAKGICAMGKSIRNLRRGVPFLKRVLLGG